MRRSSRHPGRRLGVPTLGLVHLPSDRKCVPLVGGGNEGQPHRGIFDGEGPSMQRDLHGDSNPSR